MHVLAIDTSQSGLELLKKSIETLYPQNEVICFQDPMMAVKHGIMNPPDAIYTAISMRRMDGFEVVRMLKEDNARLLINFVADDDSFWEDAVRIGMNSYTIKPVTADKLRAAENEVW